MSQPDLVKYNLKMLGLLGLGAALALPVVGLWLYELNESSFLAGGSRYKVVVPSNPVTKVKEQAFYCTPGVAKKTIGCN